MIEFPEPESPVLGPHPPEVAVVACAGPGPLILLESTDYMGEQWCDDDPTDPVVGRPSRPGVWLWVGRFDVVGDGYWPFEDFDLVATGEWRELTTDELEFLASGDRLALLIEAGVPEVAVAGVDPEDKCPECGAW